MGSLGLLIIWKCRLTAHALIYWCYVVEMSTTDKTPVNKRLDEAASVHVKRYYLHAGRNSWQVPFVFRK